MWNTIPFPLLTDSYKATHFAQYPEATHMYAYGECRGPLDDQDERLVMFGVRYYVERLLNHQYTMAEVDEADRFFGTHNAGHTQFPWPRDLFIKFINENNGYFPVKVKMLPEGTVFYPHIPFYTIEATDEYARLVTYLETILTMLWYPITVATLSRHAWDKIADYFELTVDEADYWLLPSRLHDFGFRGTSSLESATLGGAAHLLSFDGTDTLSAAYWVQTVLNQGKPVGSSIPATEHSVMLSWPNEQAAVENMFTQFGGGLLATVADTYSYTKFLNELVPAMKDNLPQGTLWVVRPDSGDPTECVLQALEALSEVFPTHLNTKGYKVIQGAAVIQGDGLNLDKLKRILEAVAAAGYSVQNVAFGMGGGLLQKINRDTLKVATKLSWIQYANGKEREVMKSPEGDQTKFSLPGRFKVFKHSGKLYVTPQGVSDLPDVLQTVYDNRPLNIGWPSFDQIRTTLLNNWKNSPKFHDPITPGLQAKINALMKQR